MPDKKRKDYYKVLGINIKATEQEIKSAYRSLARKYHPDVNQDNIMAEEIFKEIGEAYSILSNEEKRNRYDILMGHKKTEPTHHKQQKTESNIHPEHKKSNTPNKNTTKHSNKQTNKQDPHNSNLFSSLFDNIMKNMESKPQKEKLKGEPRFSSDSTPIKEKKPSINEEKITYSDLSKKPKPQPNPQRGDDITINVFLTTLEAKNGVVRKVNIMHSDPCAKCNATGIFANSPCKDCEGRGSKNIHKKLDVKIPAAIKNGSKVRISNEGNRGINGGDNGDLYLLIKVYNKESFRYEGIDVYSEVPIAPHEAILGGEIKVLTIDGFVSMKMNPLTQPGQKFRLTNQGLPDKDNKRGDHYVIVKIEIPSQITQKEKQLYQDIANISKFNPREYFE